MNDRPVAKNDPRDLDLDRDRDPTKRASGSHPVGTGVGAVAGGVAAGAAIGTVAGPIGTAIGAAVGAVAGGLAGKSIAEQLDPSAEDAYWRDNYTERPYVESGMAYDEYGPAYRYGVDSYGMYGGSGRNFEEIEPELETGWSRARGESSLGWGDARHASRDSWDRVSERIERAVPGDSDRDGK